MNPVPLKTAQRDLLALVRIVHRDGERIVLTRRGHPVAALVPFGALAALDLLGRMLPSVADVAAGLSDPARVAAGPDRAPVPGGGTSACPDANPSGRGARPVSSDSSRFGRGLAD